MKTVAIKELKNNLSSYLREVKNGEVILVTDRGSVVAELRQPTMGTAIGAHDRIMERLCAEGILVAGLPQNSRAYRRSPLPRAVVSTDLLDAERRDRGRCTSR